jgi:hypothetical protein
MAPARVLAVLLLAVVGCVLSVAADNPTTPSPQPFIWQKAHGTFYRGADASDRIGNHSTQASTSILCPMPGSSCLSFYKHLRCVLNIASGVCGYINLSSPKGMGPARWLWAPCCSMTVPGDASTETRCFASPAWQSPSRPRTSACPMMPSPMTTVAGATHHGHT